MLITCNQSCRAVLILLTAAAGPPQTCPRPGGEGGERQKKSSAFLLRCGRVCAFLSSCMEIIPIGGDCFPGEGMGGGARVSGGRGSLGAPKGRSILSGCRGREAGSLLQLPVSLQGPWDASRSQDETSRPTVPPHLPLVLSLPPPAPCPPQGRILDAVGSARSCRGDARWCRGAKPATLAPAFSGTPPQHRQLGGLPAISYSSHVLPGGGRAAAGAPKWLQSVALRHDSHGSGAAAGSGSRLPDKGPGTKARLPRAPGKGRRRVRDVGAGLAWGCCCPLSPHAHRGPVSTQPPPWLAQPGRSWVPGGTALALVPRHPSNRHCARHRSGCGAVLRPLAGPAPPVLPVSGCSGAEMGCCGAQGYGEGAENMDGATAEDGKCRADPPSPPVPQFPQLLSGPL